MTDDAPHKRPSRRFELELAAAKFHAEHPDVWQLFCKFTYELIGRGFQHHSADAVMHRVRWETAAGDDTNCADFKISNSHIAFYARWFMEAHPQYDGFFRLKFQPSAIQPPKIGGEDGSSDHPSTGTEEGELAGRLHR